MGEFIDQLLKLLHVRSAVVGLEISDSAIRMARFEGKLWRLNAIRLAPGIMVNGKLNDRDSFIASLNQLKAEAKISAGPERKISVAIALSSVNPYTQVFTLPIIEGENFEQAVELNLKMATPGEVAQTYSSWQVVHRDEAAAKLEVLSAFMDRQVVDAIVDALSAAGFLTMAVESRALALTRFLREKSSSADLQKPCILLNVDTAGLDFLIIRNSNLYFEYVSPWNQITDEKGDIQAEKFKTELVASLRQVVNFYNQHWPDPIGMVIISATTFQNDIEKAVAENFPFPAVLLTLEMGQPISSEWLVALGVSLRGNRLKGSVKEISLLGQELEEKFQEDQVLAFLHFWQLVIPVVCVVFIAMFGISDAFLVNSKNLIESQSNLALGTSEGVEISAYTASSTDFNNLVSMVQIAENDINPQYSILAEIQSLFVANQAVISTLNFPGTGQTISLTGVAQSEDDIVALKTAFGQNQDFSQVNLPLTEVKQNGSGFLFSMTFVASPVSRSGSSTQD